jgi:hypothetical protein
LCKNYKNAQAFPWNHRSENSKWLP